jgi:hypothetical protein
MLSEPTFLPEGGTLGFFCTNNYCHTGRGAEKKFPHSLRGIDYIFFSACKALGVKAEVRPVLGDEAWDEWYEHRLQKFMEVEEDSSLSLPSQPNTSRIGHKFGRIKMVDVEIKEGEDPSKVVGRYFPYVERQGVLWLNEARHEGWEVQMVNLRGVGDEGEEREGEGEGEGGLMWHYSCVGILVEVPGWGEREREMVEGEEEEEEEMSG